MKKIELLKMPRKWNMLVKLLIGFVLIISFLAFIFILIKGKRTEAVVAANDNEQMSLIPMEEYIDVSQSEEDEAVEAESEQNTVSENDTDVNIEQITYEPLKVSDLYTEAGNTVKFKSYNADAESYTWEIYNLQKKTWEINTADVSQETDELHRPLSVLRVSPKTDTAIRCTTNLLDGSKLTEMATVFIVPEIKDIQADEFVAEAGTYLCSQNIPVNVTYADGTQDKLTGLCSLSFVESTESKEASVNEYGENVEVVSIINKEHDFQFLGEESRDVLLRYHQNDKTYDIELTVSGKDSLAPQIKDVNVGEFKVSNIDEPVNVSIKIEAEDNYTPYPYLQYAFLPKDVEPKEEDWIKSMSFDKEITQNGIWIAYCKDASGNIASTEKEIITVDEKAPIISIGLENDNWCVSNKIIVKAKDGLPVEYSFSCPETGEQSGWTAENEYPVSKNGTWEIQVKDAAGNVVKDSVTVNNIDNQIPVIKFIKEERGQDHDYNKENE